MLTWMKQYRGLLVEFTGLMGTLPNINQIKSAHLCFMASHVARNSNDVLSQLHKGEHIDCEP